MRRSELVAALALALAFVATPVQAAAPSCRLPDAIPPARAIVPPRGEAPRRTPVDGYLLAMSWSPEYCRTRKDSAADRLQCGRANRFGFVLHGLWPESDRGGDPRWCSPAGALPADLVRRHLCDTPSVQLMQREWAKHGTCAARSPAGYFQAASMLYRAVRFPDMDALSRQPLTAGAFRRTFAKRNTGITADMVAVDANPRGWLEEVRLCLGPRMKPRACARGDRGVGDDAPLKIWRGGR
ncbi:ribonuclease T2 family protein [Sphingomonas sanxanigenens]|uniref:Uncharacterized protein n=1 Tax=Sphingomonas sanxanigenens DSM 19645 = NX02 TaxID=1123269 RepID=W0AAE8_9SPHN|nr:hypothetical protein [Sphingomonas sanxanigenens]AHE54914.1 hypothetical protein NX02_16170 [Sphingomonas sanxanigenens DSM 19645 = NX02]